jgi:hypothetical protein
LLEGEGIAVVGIAASGEETVRMVSALASDVALVDIRLGKETGFDVARCLSMARTRRRRRPSSSRRPTGGSSDRGESRRWLLATTDLSAERIRSLLGV